MAYLRRPPQDKLAKKRSDAIRAAWNVFSEEAWANRGMRKSQNNVQMSSEQLEILFLREARGRWLKVLKENKWYAGDWVMTETDEEEVSTLLNWTRDKLVSAADEDWGIYVNPGKLKHDMMDSGPETSSLKPAQPVVQPQPTHSRPLHPQDSHAPQTYARRSGIGSSEYPIHAQVYLPQQYQQSLAPRPVTQSPYARPLSRESSRVRQPHNSRSYRTTSSNNDKQEDEGETGDNEEESDDNDDEEEEDSYDVDEGEDSDDVTEEEDNDQDRTTNRVISGASDVAAFPLIEPFFDDMHWVDLETKSPKTASFASKSAYAWMGRCHAKAAQNMMLLSKLRVAGLATKQEEKRLILQVERYCRRSHKKWRRAVNTKWEQRRRRRTQPPTRNEPHVPERGTMPRTSNVRQAQEGPGLSQRPQRDYTDDLSSGEQRYSRASSLPKKRGKRVLRTIFEQLEPIVRERTAAGNNLPSGEIRPPHADGRPTPKASPLMPKGIKQPDPVRGESSRRPPPTLRRSSTPAPSQPNRALSAMWYDIDEEAIATKEKPKLTPWGPVPYEYEEIALPQNGSNSTRSSAFIRVEEGGEQYWPARHDEEETSDKESESDWDTDISSESSFAITEASFAHFMGSGRRGPTDERPPGNARGTNPDWLSAQRAARGAQVLPRSRMTDISSVSSIAMTEASFADFARSGQPGPSSTGKYAPGTSNARGTNPDQLNTQRPARASRALPGFRMS